MTKADKIIQALLNKEVAKVRSLLANNSRQEVIELLRELQVKVRELPYYENSPFPADREWSLREAIAYISTPKFAKHFLKIFRTRK